MKASEFKAVLASTPHFAAFRQKDITEIDNDTYKYSQGRNLRSCPDGLRKVTVLETNCKWLEPFTLGCGDTVHHRERRNGIRIEFPLPKSAPSDAKTPKGKRQTARAFYGSKPTAVVFKHEDHDGQLYVRQLVTASAIIAPWGEYSLIEAEREKIRAEYKARTDRFEAAAKVLGVRPWRQSHYDITEMGARRERPEGEPYREHEVDCLVIPIGQMERIARELAGKK